MNIPLLREVQRGIVENPKGLGTGWDACISSRAAKALGIPFHAYQAIEDGLGITRQQGTELFLAPIMAGVFTGTGKALAKRISDHIDTFIEKYREPVVTTALPEMPHIGTNSPARVDACFYTREKEKVA